MEATLLKGLPHRFLHCEV